ncbi:MAG: hypothetical protein SFU87_06400 [Chitinophagaceae bacterium]|nr:hypothetical protein [Chitinophagaceae bacterium]
MNEKTVYLHHTFHHGGALKAANVDLQKICNAIGENTSKTGSWYKSAI